MAGLLSTVYAGAADRGISIAGKLDNGYWTDQLSRQDTKKVPIERPRIDYLDRVRLFSTVVPTASRSEYGKHTANTLPDLLHKSGYDSKPKMYGSLQ